MIGCVSWELARLVEGQGIRDPAVLQAIAETPRELFVPERLRAAAGDDRPLPIGFGQTISQPFVVAFMTERLELTGAERVLEVGTGSGYQTAVLARLAARVYSIEIVGPLSERASELLLGTCGLANVELRTGDGSLGWPEAAPFDRIIVTAAAAEVPGALLDQLAPGGRMILPVGAAPDFQMLRLLRKGKDGRVEATDLLPVRFVRLV
jgi:protein-L-isoaspartate(D-aspartate) O-methyltransferase